MAIAIPSKDSITSDNIILGYAELVALRKKGRIHWQLPGGCSTPSRPHAMEFARQLDNMIRSNMERLNSDLLWP